MRSETRSTKKVLVWDVPVRLVHWLLVASFACAFLTADSERLRTVHVLFGTTLANLILFRLVWGIVGTRYARFTSFAFGPRAVLRYLRSVATLKSVRYIGHTPAGSWAIWLMLGLGLAVAATGYGDYAGGAEWLEDTHGALAWVLSRGRHVAAVPGAKRERWVVENARAAELELTPADLAEIAGLPRARGSWD